jgi:membrane protease YdiL (CAAX protease family)
VSAVIARRRGWLRLAPLEAAERQAARSPSTDRAVVLVGLFLMQILVPAVVVALLHGRVDPTTLFGKATLQWASYLAQVPFAIGIVLRAATSPVRGRWPHDAASGVIGLCAVAPLIIVASQLATALQAFITGEPPTALGHETLRVLLDSWHDPWSWAVIAAVTIGAPIFEEIAYRLGLHGSLRELGIGRWSTIGLTSVFFAIMHIGSIPREALAGSLLGLFLLSAALGLLRERTNGVIAPIIAHSLFNVANLALAFAFL